MSETYRDGGHNPHHNRHAGLPGFMRRHHKKRWDLDSLTDTIREFILKGLAKSLHGDWESVTKEGLSSFLHADKDLVVAALHRLNLEGLVHRRTKQAAHDCSRSGVFAWPGYSGWAAGVYYVVRPEERKKR